MSKGGSVTKYYHEAESKKVIAKLSNVKRVEDELIKNNIAEVIFFNRVTDKHSDCFTGSATCDDQDVFDIDKGKKIASLKADLKYHRNRINIYTRMFERCAVIADMLDKIIEKHKNSAIAIEEKLCSDYEWDRGKASSLSHLRK